MAICSCSLRFLVPGVWSASSPFGVSTADCVGGKLRHGSGGDEIVNASGGSSLAGVKDYFGDDITLQLRIPRDRVADERSDKPRCECRTDMAEAVARIKEWA